MKKSCLVALGALVACIGAANAASMKETCLANSDKFVWDESLKDCVPINPCLLSETSDYYKVYCNDMFSGYKYLNDPVGNTSFVETVTTYWNKAWGNDWVCNGDNSNSSKYLISCKDKRDGGYMQFYVSKQSGFSEGLDYLTARTALCEALGGKLVETTVCEGLRSSFECKVYAGDYYNTQGFETWNEERKRCRMY